MQQIEFITNLALNEIPPGEKSKEAKEIFSGVGRRLLEITLRNNVRLAKHQAAEPITVLCLAGKGVFRAGPDLAEEAQLVAGTLLTLAAGVEHEVVAEPALRLLVTKFLEV